jgi:hypothetical protein
MLLFLLFSVDPSYALLDAVSAALLDEITAISSFQDFTNDSAPSS